MKPRVYTASTLRHGPMWIQLRAQWSEIYFTARWLDTYLDWSGPTIEGVCREAWDRIEADVANSRFVLVYADTIDLLRGGLIETGMGIIGRKQIITIGDHQSYGTWQYHRQVKRLPDLPTARKFINES